MLFLSSTFSNEFNKNSENSQEIVFYISPNGDDENAGTKESPFLTLEQAKLSIESNMGNSITLYLREGYYPLEESLVLSKVYAVPPSPIPV